MAMDAQHSIPAVHALHLVELVRRWDVSPEELLAPLGLRAEALADPGARMPVRMVEALVEQARRLTGEPGLGFFLGLQMRVSSHGYLGFAAMTSATRGSLATMLATGEWELSIEALTERMLPDIVARDLRLFGLADVPLLAELAAGRLRKGQTLAFRTTDEVRLDDRTAALPDARDLARTYIEFHMLGGIVAAALR